ncbi:DNA repair protein RecO [Actinorhabdospora filicis]|uniref:DNA repair protein RecO n=2 Tax=Actinorhabdospora filicis TaxID=1785913 RepID=A0A9W6SRF1_9ACTN|nr:DNA repair protein RecO [Actinorhabdospora filicis]
MRRRLFRDDAVVLRVQKLGEADHIVTMLARRGGRIRAVAKGVRRTTSKFGARLEPFGHIDLQMVEGRNLHIVSQVEGIDLYGRRIAEDYAAYTAASAIAETAERLTPIEGEATLRLFQLTLGAMRVLAERAYPSTLILDSYILRGMRDAGWAPVLIACAICGLKGDHRAFSIPAGGCVCRDCRPAGSAHPSPSALVLMRALADGDWKTATASENGVRKEASGLIAAHLQWHLERDLRSLSLVERN